MTNRERFRAVLQGKVADRIPMVSRLDIWYTACRNAGSLPKEVEGMTIPEIEDRLGMGRSARFRSFQREAREGVQERVAKEGDKTIRTLEFGGRSLREVRLHTGEQRAKGVSGQIQEHFLKSADDYRTMIEVWERTRFEADHDALRRFDRDTGEDGLPLLVLGPLPIHRIMLEYAGYQSFYFHMADFPHAVEELLRAMEARYEEFWPELAAAQAEMILYGSHWNSDMTPPPLFEKYFLPHARRFTDAMHRAGKKCVFHADADVRKLLDLVLLTGMDVADCFACAPLVPLTLTEARQAWGPRIVLWGGWPSTLLEPSTSEKDFRAHLDRFCREIADGKAIIVAVSDNVMPGTIWERLVALAERVTSIRPTG